MAYCIIILERNSPAVMHKSFIYGIERNTTLLQFPNTADVQIKKYVIEIMSDIHFNILNSLLYKIRRRLNELVAELPLSRCMW